MNWPSAVVAAIRACGDLRVAAALLATPRERFLATPTGAGCDEAIPIAAGQTCSQPSLVARMLALLRLAPGQCVLDVGCGSGWVTVIMAQLVAPEGRVIAIERQAELVARARPLLPANVDLRHGDGLAGAADAAPFAAIHVGAACPRVPTALLAQLAIGGRLVLPVGPYTDDQILTCIERRSDGSLHETTHDAVRFVPCLPGIVALEPA